MTILTIDLGTQSVRAAFVDIKGRIESRSQLKQEVDSPYDGWAQQQPKMWWDLTKKAIRQLLDKSAFERESIQGIGVCGQMHGPVGIDNNGGITTQWTQIWCDKRCENICDLIKKDHDEQDLVKITGNRITTGWPGVKVKWIKENQPEIYDKTRWFLVPKDFINYKLTGVAATDPSEASGTYLYNYENEQYSSQMAEILDIDLEKFAPIKNSYEKIGYIKKEVAEKLNLPSNLPVIAGGGDFIVSLLGLGLVGKGSAVDMTGTSSLFVVQKEEPIIHPLVQNLKHVVEGWVPFTMLDTGGLSMKWCKDFLESVGKENISYERMIEMAKNVPIGSEGLLFYPYMLGERRKENILAKGCFFGLNLNHKASHMARSVMEGVALALGKDLQNFKDLGVNINKVYCVGGATRNKLLYKIKADVMNLPQILAVEPESSLRGCGLLAAYGLGLVKDLNSVAKLDDLNTQVISPDVDAHAKYEKILQEFKKMYNFLLGFWT